MAQMVKEDGYQICTGFVGTPFILHVLNDYGYANESVADWVYKAAVGIWVSEANPGFEKVRIAPMPDSRIKWLEASIHTRHGLISSRWTYGDHTIKYEITTEVPAVVAIRDREIEVLPGSYIFWE